MSFRAPLYGLALVVLTGCSTTVAGGQGDVPDARPPLRFDAAPVTSADAAPTALPCIEGDAQAVDPGAGTCYMLFSEIKTWQAAQADCLALSGTLAIVADANAQALVATLSEQHPVEGPDLWLGATDEALEGTFAWVDGTAFAFTQWRDGEPNNNGPGEDPENCLVIEGDTILHEWDDRSCIVAAPFICQRDG